MTVLMVPKLDKKAWPSLGHQLIDWMEANLVFGPGDLRGDPLVLDDEQRALIIRAYEVYPKGHAMAGRRRFKRVAFSMAKGLRKTELAALLAAAELHPEAPVRCDGFDRWKRPVGRGVTDPYIPLVAYTEEQSDELAYGALRVILEESNVSDDFDIGLERILRRGGDGRAVSLATAPNARDGARTTFQVFDESHRMTLASLLQAHQVMLANIPKRRLADPWSLEITTAPEPGVASVAASTMEYAQAVADGRIEDANIFFFHRQAGNDHNLETEDGARAAVIEASGEAASWRDIDGIVNLWKDPTTDRRYWERVWTNRLVQSTEQAFDIVRWRDLLDPQYGVDPGALITLGFDGARYHDATALVATEVATGYQWLVGLWEAAPGEEQWEVPSAEVDAAVEQCFEKYKVWRMNADPYWWQTQLGEWAGRYGDKVVVQWTTTRYRAMAQAIKTYVVAIQSGEVRHDGNPNLSRHLANAHRKQLNFIDEDGQAMWILQKERNDSPRKIDAAMAAVLSWEARTMALASGVTGSSIYDQGASVFL